MIFPNQKNHGTNEFHENTHTEENKRISEIQKGENFIQKGIREVAQAQEHFKSADDLMNITRIGIDKRENENPLRKIKWDIGQVSAAIHNLNKYQKIIIEVAEKNKYDLRRAKHENKKINVSDAEKAISFCSQLDKHVKELDDLLKKLQSNIENASKVTISQNDAPEEAFQIIAEKSKGPERARFRKQISSELEMLSYYLTVLFKLEKQLERVL